MGTIARIARMNGKTKQAQNCGNDDFLHSVQSFVFSGVKIRKKSPIRLRLRHYIPFNSVFVAIL